MKKKLKILKDNHPILRKKSRELQKEEIATEDIQSLIQNMKSCMRENKGVGLAAPQIGQNIRLILVGTESRKLVMINPQITKKSWAKERGEEGCLSVPGTFGNVVRHKKINCIFLDESGKKNKLQACQMTARIIQHEIDHLNGKLFTDIAENIRIEKIN